MNKITAILLGGVIAGTVDIGAAMLINNVDYHVILRAIASGLKGKAAFTEAGMNVEWLGLGLQELMGVIIAAVFVGASSFLPMLAKRWLVFGVLYGLGIYVVMNYVVVQLSAAHHKLSFPPHHLVGDLIAMTVFGLIVAFFAHLATRAPRSAPAVASAAAV